MIISRFASKSKAIPYLSQSVFHMEIEYLNSYLPIVSRQLLHQNCCPTEENSRPFRYAEAHILSLIYAALEDIATGVNFGLNQEESATWPMLSPKSCLDFALCLIEKSSCFVLHDDRSL